MRKLLLLFAVMMAMPSFAQWFEVGDFNYEVLDSQARTCRVRDFSGGGKHGDPNQSDHP